MLASLHAIVIQQLDEEATQFCRVLSDKVIWLDRQGVVTEVLDHDTLGHPKDLLVTSSPAKAKSFYMHRNFDLSNIPSLPGVGFSFSQRIISGPKNNSTRTWLHAPLCASVKAASPEFYLDSDFPEGTWCARFHQEQNSEPIAISQAQTVFVKRLGREGNEVPVNLSDQRFRGYYADHYRVRLGYHDLRGATQRHGNALVEIQVATVLMHAWSEVNHDLGYKPFTGPASEDEMRILDGINGIVHAGEVFLQQLQWPLWLESLHQRGSSQIIMSWVPTY